jgi:hypothetical protein
MTTSNTHRDSLIQRAAESLRQSERAERLGSALTGLAQELAAARRQIAMLKRENAALRAQLGGQAGATGTPPPARGRPGNRRQPRMRIGGHTRA